MIHFVGAGPGAADLITVRGQRLLAAADLVVYAGSLVSPDLLAWARDDAGLLDSSGLTLDEITDALIAADRAGRTAVRLQTGDLALYGALAEQAAALDAAGVAWDVTPGVSSLFAASAALRVAYTAPGLTQSLVVTRVGGRTEVPERERLSSLAAHGTSLVLFLSATLVEEAQAELLAAGRAPDEPAALVVRASWPDERIWRCSVSTLAACAAEHNVCRQTLILVGAALAGARERSRLYDPTFSHGYRQAGGSSCA